VIRWEIVAAIATAVSVLASAIAGQKIDTADDQRLTAIHGMAYALAECERRHDE
jgi:hypothetical protein